MSFGTLGTPTSKVCSLDYNLEDYSDVLARLLSKYNLEVDDFYAFHDPSTGDVFINLTDKEGDSIESIFTCDSDGVPGCSILDPSTDDESGWIDLHGVLPMNNEVPVFGNGKWLRKTVLTNLMTAGKVDYEEVKESGRAGDITHFLSEMDEAFTMRGNRKIHVVTHQKRSRRISEKQKIGLAAARRLHHIKRFKSKSPIKNVK
jgi:hypothetical protein